MRASFHMDALFPMDACRTQILRRRCLSFLISTAWVASTMIASNLCGVDASTRIVSCALILICKPTRPFVLKRLGLQALQAPHFRSIAGSVWEGQQSENVIDSG